MILFGCALVLLLPVLSVSAPAERRPDWVARYDAPTRSDDVAWAIAVDSDGNVYVTGLCSLPFGRERPLGFFL